MKYNFNIPWNPFGLLVTRWLYKVIPQKPLGIITKILSQHPKNQQNQMLLDKISPWNSFSYIDLSAEWRHCLQPKSTERRIIHSVCQGLGRKKGQEWAQGGKQDLKKNYLRRNQVKELIKHAWTNTGEIHDKTGVWKVKKADEGWQTDKQTSWMKRQTLEKGKKLELRRVTKIHWDTMGEPEVLIHNLLHNAGN